MRENNDARTKKENPNAWYRFWLLSLLFCVVVAELLYAVALHRDQTELEALVEWGAPKERVYALYVLSQRNVPYTFREEEVRALLASDDSLVREWAMTTNFVSSCESTAAQQEHLNLLIDSPEAGRSRFLFANRKEWMTMDEFRGFLSCLHN